MSEIKYGIMSDIHEDPRTVKKALREFGTQGVEKVILNGDLIPHGRTIEDTQKNFALVLDALGRSGLEAYIQPGSHESIATYEPVLDYFMAQYSNLIDVLKNPKFEMGSHNLLFIPGSDVNAGGGEYTFGKEMPTGKSFFVNGKRKSVESLEDIDNEFESLKKGDKYRLVHYTNVNDMKKYLNNPDNTVVICHVPRRFDNPATGVDYAYYGENAEKAVVPGRVLEEMITDKIGEVPLFLIKHYAAGTGWTFNKANRGNEDLKKLYEETGVTKAVSGHFHEASHRAHDARGIVVPQNVLVNELYWNAGHMDSGHAGVLTVRDNKVSYRNVLLPNVDSDDFN